MPFYFIIYISTGETGNLNLIHMKVQILNKLKLSFKLKQSLRGWIQEDRRRGYEYRNYTCCEIWHTLYMGLSNFPYF